MVLSPKKLPPSNALFLRRATFVNAVKYGVGLAGSEKGRTFASAIGNSGAAEEWHGRERERRSLHSGLGGKPERTEGVARAPSAQKGLGRKAAKGSPKKSWPTAWKFQKNAYLCSPQTRERDALRSADGNRFFEEVQ